MTGAEIDLEILSQSKLPLLKKGELATEGNFLFLHLDEGQIEVFIKDELLEMLTDFIIQMHVLIKHH